MNKQTYSAPGHLEFDQESIVNEQGKQIAGPCEIGYLILTSSSPSGGNVSVHDCTTVAEAGYNNEKMNLDCSNTGNDSRIFTNPPKFERGIVVVLHQGAGLGIALDYGTVLPH